MTLYTLPGAAATAPITPQQTLSYDTKSNIWGIWTTTINGHTHFPLIAWTKRTGGFNPTVSARAGEGMLFNGDIITLSDNMIPQDSIGGFLGYFVANYMEDGYFTSATLGTTSAIPLKIRTGLWDGGTSKLKTQYSLKPIIEETATSQDLVIQWSTRDEQNGTFTTGRTIDTSKRAILRRGGIFTKRNFQLSYTGTDPFYMTELELDVTLGDY